MGSPKEAAAHAIAARLRADGHTAYFAGGCVRDRLLGREPKDFDVATSAPAALVQQIFPRTVPVGAQFGVVLVLHDEQPVEVATFRADVAYVDGRHPVSVRFSSPQEDAQRRDFTINGMFLDPTTDQIIDYVGGQADLRAGIIRAIGDAAARIKEDRLRMLRAVRFAAQLGFTIDPATFAAIRAAAASITDIAWERIGDEIVRMLTESRAGSARRAFELLDDSGLLPHVLPEVDALHGVEQSPDFHPEGDVFVHTLGLLEQLDQPTESLALGALLHDVAKPTTAVAGEKRITFYGHCEIGADMAVAVCQRLRRSRETWDRVAYLVRDHLRHVNAPEMRLSTLKRFLASNGIRELLALARLDAMASNKDLSAVEFCEQKLAELSAEQIKPPPLLRGRDLIELGLKPGPAFAEILNAIVDGQLEGTLIDREQAIEWVKQRYGLGEA
ncbi:MAG: CCA tRNA nucleotidyltransferase [Deltaproteobacteria bacterium]|nr:CCA tRNA nucleotidyltransferase [Deltaproteobacteria bacterium]